MSQPQPRTLGGRYDLDRPIGEGNFSVTHRATDNVLGREVAIKILREQYLAHEGFASRFENEARAAAAISHPNVIQVFDYGREDRTAYIVMQYVPGSSLKDYIRAEGPLTADQTVDFTRQILAGLAAIHAAGIIHRDIKPQNVLMGDNQQLKLTDFGIARVEAGASGLTESGTAIGTAAYMAPEQAVGGTVTPATDLYAVGVMMYEMLTGRLPFPGDNPVQIMYRHVNEMPPSPRTLIRDIPPEVEAVVMRALAKDPEDRFPNALAMRNALLSSSPVPVVPVREMISDPSERTAVTPAVGAAPPRVPPPPRREAYPASRGGGGGGRRRNRWSSLLPILVFGALALLIAGIVAASQLDEDDTDNPVGVVDESTATAEPSPTLTPTIEPTATAEPTNTPPPPTATQTPTPEPPTPTPEPPTPTPEPPTPTPEPPTPTPTPTEEPEPEPEPTEAPEPPDVPDVAFNTPFPIASLPTDVSQGPSSTIDAGGFEGVYRRDDGVLYGLPAAHLYGTGSGANSATATFTANTTPSEYILVQLTGIDDEIAGKVPMRVSLNGNVVWEGPSPFQNGTGDFESTAYWTDVGWLVGNLGWLNEGQNTLTVEIVGIPGQIGTPPWVLLTSAVVYYQ